MTSQTAAPALDADDVKKTAEELAVSDGATVMYDPATGDFDTGETLGVALQGLPPASAAAALKACDLDATMAAAPEVLKRGRSKAKPGLLKKARGIWILTGEDSTQQGARARGDRERSQAGKAQAAGTPTARGPREEGSVAQAMKVLKGRTKPMTPQEIYDAGMKKGLFAHLTGKTPVATLAAQLAVANKKGRHVERPEPGRYQLRPEGK